MLLGKSAVYILGVFVFGLAAHGRAQTSQKIQLSPQIVVEKVLGDGYKAKDTELSAQSKMLAREKKLGEYDLKAFGNIGYEYNEGEDLEPVSNPLDKTYKFELGLKKLSRYGTNYSFGYKHMERNSILHPLVSGTKSPNTAMDVLGLEIKQSLLYNTFGYSGRKEIASAELAVSAAELERQENLENLVLESMQLYWDAYVAQVKLRDAIASRASYEGLLKTVRSRGRFGIEKKGELPHVQAQVEAANAKVKLASLEYLKKLDSLLREMKIEAKGDVEFLTTSDIPQLPTLQPKDIKTLRAYKIANLNKDSAQYLFEGVQNKGRPVIDLVAKAETVGVETAHKRSFAEAVAGKKPNYYVGLEFQTSIDGSTSASSLADARITAAKAANESARNEHEMRSKVVLTEDTVRAYYSVAKSKVTEVELREKATRDQEAGYRQGRIPLSELIKSYEDLFKAQTEKSTSIGEYHIALNKLAAFRDELVEEKTHAN